MAWKLQPSKRRGVTVDGPLAFFPLWETPNGLLIWSKRGIRGDRPPAAAASGRVPCKYAADPACFPVDLMGGCPLGGYVEAEMAEGATEKIRMLIVCCEDGLLEPTQVLVVDELRLA